MNLLITGADQPLGRLAAESFGKQHRLRLAGRGAAGEEGYAQVDLRNPEAVEPLVGGVNAILHLDVFDALSVEIEKECLDWASRGTYVLLSEARKAGVERVVLASTLAMMEAYPEDYVVDEVWKPLPMPDAESLAPYLSELTLREYAREGGICGICLRFGALGEGTSETEALMALEGALAMSFEDSAYRWHLFHVASGGRFETQAALEPLGLEKEAS